MPDAVPTPHKLRVITLLLFVLLLCAGCVGTVPPQGTSLHGPVVVLKKDAVAATRDEACRRVAPHRVLDDDKGAWDVGMLKSEYDVIRKVIRKADVIATFRDSNKACLPHLAEGVQSKPHAILQKTWDEENLLPQDKHLAGLVSPYMAKPPKGVQVPNPQLVLYHGEPVTCDYDLMDLLEADGRRIGGESSRELEIRHLLNQAIPPTPQGHRDRIMHGSQAGYGDYIRLHQEEPPVPSLFKPEAPLTAFTPDGNVYQLETLPDVMNLYTCKGAPLPPEWDVEVETATGRSRLH